MKALVPSVGMTMAVLAQVSSMELQKAAMSRGTNKYVLIVYSNVVASLILLPCAFIFHGSVRLPIRSVIPFRVFLLSIIGTAAQVSGYAGIQYSSVALETAMLNLIPAFTFILALTFRMEKLDLRSRSSQAKSLGTLVSILGAAVATLYQGPPILGPVLKTSSSPKILILFTPQLNWILGGVLLAGEAFSISAWYILQTIILKDFPKIITVLFYLSFFNAALTAAYSVILVEDRNAWIPKPDIGLVAIMYHGIVATVLRIGITSWCLSRVGPLVVSMFKPLAIIFAVVIGVSFLGETLFLGSLVGAAIIVCGFYAVLWGKVKEAKMISDEISKSAEQNVPFLQNTEEEGRCVA